MSRIRLGVLGCANIADRSVIPAIKAIEEFDLVAVASRSHEKAKIFSEKFMCEPVVGYQALIDRTDIDAVYMPLPTGLHDEWIDKTLDSGKHILVEKSLAESYLSAVKLIDKAKQKKLLVMENFMFPYHSQNKYVKELINSGEIGEIRSFRSAFGFPPLKNDNFRYNKKLGGGALYDAGAYTVKASQFILGYNHLKVTASDMFFREGIDIYGSAYLSGENEAVSQISWGFDNFYQCNYEVWGSTGKITVERAFTAAPDFKPKIVIEKQGDKQEIYLPSDNHFVNLLKEFYRAIAKSDFDFHYHSTLEQSKLIDAIRHNSNN